MFGIDDLIVGGLIASLAGSAISFSANSNAARAAERARLDAIRQQQELGRQAGKLAMDRAQDYQFENRKNEQKKIQDRLEQEFATPALEAQAINQQASTTQGDVSGDYNIARAASNAKVEQNTRNLARLFAKTGGASLLRRNEAYKIADTAQGIGLLQNFSQGQNAVDQMKIAEAANSGSGTNFLGNIISSLGSAAMMYGGGLGKAVNPGTALDNAARSYASGFGNDFSKKFIGDARGLLFP